MLLYVRGPFGNNIASWNTSSRSKPFSMRSDSHQFLKESSLPRPFRWPCQLWTEPDESDYNEQRRAGTFSPTKWSFVLVLLGEYVEELDLLYNIAQKLSGS